jgi:hypothetical protein
MIRRRWHLFNCTFYIFILKEMIFISIVLRKLHLLSWMADLRIFIVIIFESRLLNLSDDVVFHVIQLGTHINNWWTHVHLGLEFLLRAITILNLLKLTRNIVEIILESRRHLLFGLVPTVLAGLKNLL